MQNFLEMGNIRVSPESGGLEIARMPTESQIIKIYDYVDEFDGEIYVDFTGDSIYANKESKEYKAGTSARKNN